MNVEQYGDKYLVTRNSKNPQYFSFYVDSDRISWSMHIWNAARFATATDARECIVEVRKRAQSKRGKR